jgi:PleD family two-component response regulator
MVSCLLIDENVTTRRNLCGLMQQLGIASAELSDAEEGVHYCHANRPDVVLLEASALPRAKEFLRLVRYQCSNTGRPVIIFYANEATMTGMGESILGGASEFLMAPFDIELLRFKLQQAGVLVAEAA